MNVLVVDDDPRGRELLREMLDTLALEHIHEADSLAAARRVLQTHPIDLALIEIALSRDARNRDGLTLVREVVERTSARAVCVTGLNQMADIRTAMRYGAYDYLLKDGLLEESLRVLVEGCRAQSRLENEGHTLRARQASAGHGLIGGSVAMQQLRWQIEKVALSDRPALIQGPTGVGKDIVAQAIHMAGPTPTEPFVAVNCAGFTETLVESELFGHKRGSFTGAGEDRKGVFELVSKGSLFLDELAEMPMGMQSKLLRAIESRRFRPVGATAERVFEGRFVAATRADLQARVRGGTFREDLYYRLDVATLRVPSLDERREDIPSLVAHFVAQHRRPLRFSADAIEALVRRDWPGNVRELRNVIDRVAIFADDDMVTAETLTRAGRLEATGVGSDDELLRRAARTVLDLPVPNKLDAMEEMLIAEAMARADHNKTAAARILGVHRKVIERGLRSRGPNEAGGEDPPPPTHKIPRNES